MEICWNNHYANSLDKAKLEVGIWNGHPPSSDRWLFEKPTKRKSLIFEFDLIRPDAPGWKSKFPVEREFDSHGLAQHILKVFMDDADERD